MALLGTGVAVVVVAVPFVFLGSARAVVIGALVSATAGVAAVGVAVWAALRQPTVDDAIAIQPEPGAVSNEISGTVHGGVVQARDIDGDIRFNRPG
ncbi:hypothetical protein [Cryptosporangium arvum]|uniref:hypothetical protein n=1 Tax=Cryptosporangium arvum TaxID=80871 RepID=UPI0004B39537|nr:hypothetical protein [Cryptosporangium arvum]